MSAPAEPPSVAFSVGPLGDAFDLLAAYAPDGVMFERAGIGVAGTPGIRFRELGVTRPADVIDVLRGETAGPAVGAVALGAIGFDPAGAGLHELVIPRRAVRRAGVGGTWRIDAEGPGARSEGSPLSAPVTGGVPHEPFSDLQLEPVPTPDAYRGSVADAIGRIRSGALRKVVLARTIEVRAGRMLDARLLAHRLRAVDPDAYTFAAPTDDGVIVGASPELLVSRFGRTVSSNPLAGSAPRSGDPDEDRANAQVLSSSAKDREEHAIVVDAVAETLGPVCEELAWDPEPVLRATANVWHLSTSFRGVLREPAPSALDLAVALHPTPAVAGTPTEAALATIHQLEPFDRGRYAGPVGWVDARGDGEWAIALRCAELAGDRATLYAGAGIVADSQPDLELDETERKFRAFLDALRWG